MDFRAIIENMSNIIGNTIADSIPFFRSSPKEAEMNPTRVGPLQHPISPPKASRANMAVPPVGMPSDDNEYTPGHIIPTEKPQSPQPIKEMTALSVITHKM